MNIDSPVINREPADINLPKNLGQQKATLQGLRQAKGQKIVVLDGDLQDSPELISELYQKSLFTTNSIFVKRIVPFRLYEYLVNNHYKIN